MSVCCRFILCLILLLATRVAGLAAVPDALRSQQIASVDPATGLLTVGADAAERKVYRCSAETMVTLNDQPAKLTDLQPGMLVVVTAVQPGVAARVAAVQTKVAAGDAKLKKVITTRELDVPATSNARQAIVIGQVYAGQIVRITARRPVRWSSGGAHRGDFCGWGGYAGGDKVLSMPRMALVAFVNKTPFLAVGDRFTFTVPEDGKLGFFANDDNVAGNEGVAELSVTLAWY